MTHPSPDPWYREDPARRAEINREGNLRRAAAWRAILAAHAGGVLRWTGPAVSRVERAADRLEGLCRSAWVQLTRIWRRPPASGPRRWTNGPLSWRELNEDELNERPGREDRRGRWLDRAPRQRW